MDADTQSQTIFGKAVVFTPPSCLPPHKNPNLKKITNPATHKNLRVYFYAGEQEGKQMVQDMLYIFELMQKKAGPKMKARINAEGKHNEPTWRFEFPGFYRWIN